mmetsp:Transcript_17804/g.25157  ORF Transcript_17804/g.25157 Transcript_17804/m.25157 type:complete len:608 (+) Transcript_17804:92-1915(+)|eukprot:CAMPEP_0184858434 /NCGR_PEP_ID=MMETSP0580-20130426/3536_1 /TAXON_ID=1118495 /ORGANISM="Dactyliosolen fragilissimus" /LENGTH=607 /DNA_ID=CAMNT_0027354575 /DNA_START=58 /DNA_END=1881 /DNA_ORIENTATION=-
MNNNDKLRKRLCTEISALPPNCDYETVRDSLKPIVDSILTDEIILDAKPGRGTDGSGFEQIPHAEHGNGFIDGSTSLQRILETPLMVACDKSQVECLRYFNHIIYYDPNSSEKHYLVGQNGNTQNNATAVLFKSVIGHPILDVSPDSKNSAMHYAALSQCRGALDLLCDLCMSENEASDNEKISISKKRVNSCKIQTYFRLLSQQNEHGDTPIMMSIVLGDNATLKVWFGSIFSTVLSHGNDIQGDGMIQQEKNVCENLRTLMKMKNCSGDSALSLAYGFGQYEILRLLIGDNREFLNSFKRDEKSCDLTNCNNLGFLEISHDDIEKCKGVLQSLDKTINCLYLDKDESSFEKLDMFKQRRTSIKRCLVLLQVSAAQLAKLKMEKLLEDETMNHTEDLKKTMKLNNKHKKKSKKSTMKSSMQKSSLCDNIKSHISNEVPINSTQPENQMKKVEEQLDPLKPNQLSRTLEDGSVVSSTNLHIKDMIANPTNSFAFHSEPKTMDQLLRENCSISSSMQPTSDDNKGTGSEEIRRACCDPHPGSELLMDSLCLDASMLLLTPQGMAMKLSPSQLDAVESILRNQLEAVRGAKAIHERVMKMEILNKEENL